MSLHILWEVLTLHVGVMINHLVNFMDLGLILGNIESLINAALNEIRPYLQADGGDISLLEVTDDNRVVVELHGACSSCNMSFMTMREGVEEAIKSAAPQIVEVVAVNHLNQPTAAN